MINDKMKIIAEQQNQRVVLKGNTIKYNQILDNGTDLAKNPTTFNGGQNYFFAKGRYGDYRNYTSQFSTALVSGHKYFVFVKFDSKLKSGQILNNLNLYNSSYSAIQNVQLSLNVGNQDNVAFIFTSNVNSTFVLNLYFLTSETALPISYQMVDLTLLGLDTITTLTDFYTTDIGKFILNGNYLPYSATNTIYSVKSPFTFKGRNLIDYKTTYDNTCFELVGNVLKNIVADQRQNDRINFAIYSWDYGSAGGKDIDTNGKFAIELHPTQSGEYNFYHSGSSTNIYITKFYLIGGETYTLSLDVISHDSRVLGGLKLENIQLEKGNEATSYLAYDNQLTYIRTKRVDLGTLTWTYDGTQNRFYTRSLTDFKKPSSYSGTIFAKAPNIKSVSLSYINGTPTENCIGFTESASDNLVKIYVIGSGTNATDFKTAMSGVILEYETAEPLELNGIGTNYDTYENHSGKVVRKIKKVKINDLDITKSGSNFNVTLTDIKSHSGTTNVPQILCSEYRVVSPVEITLANQVISQNNKVLTIKDTNYSTVSALKSAKGNVEIYYILETPTTENERSVLVDHRYNKVVDSNGNEIDTD